jgi:hypothetical protein
MEAVPQARRVEWVEAERTTLLKNFAFRGEYRAHQVIPGIALRYDHLR